MQRFVFDTPVRSMRWGIAWFGFWVAAGIGCPGWAQQPPSASAESVDRIDFESQVLPILQDSCQHCHGEDEQESGFRVDGRAHLLRGGDSGAAAIVPGDPQSSYLLDLVKHVEEGMEMPPDEEKLSKQQIDVLARWIRQGAVWPGQMEAVELKLQGADHWAFQKVTRPEVPPGSQHPVDAFIDQAFAKQQLTANGSADPRQLIRRASIVLTGLIPTPERVEQFVADSRKDPATSYEHLVDELLQSPHFGERWAQHWLDVIRWSESNGSESNLYRKNAWVYRDYVIRSLNEDKPYNQFVREQLAGDVMGSGEALGFLVAGPHVPAATVGQEASAIRQARADRMDEVMQTVGASMIGMTVGCARCHNHKFDPLTITDYYAMTAVFQDIEFGSRFPELSQDHPRRQRGQAIWTQINQQRNRMRPHGGWEENWGAYREMHLRPVTTTAVRINFQSVAVGIDELEVFGPQDNRENLALAASGTQVSGPDEMVGDPRNVITRLNDGEYGTMAWRARGNPKDKTKRPYAIFEFTEPKQINRLRISSNREYFYDTDYLTQKPGLNFGDYDVQVRDQEGNWKTIASSWYMNQQLNKDIAERGEAMEQIQRLIDLLAEEGPRPSFIGRFVEPAVTRVLHRGSPENPKAEVMPSAPAVFGGDFGLDSNATGAQRRQAFAQWVVSPENPLTSRVMVNRIWHHLFGAGIVTTTSDFGTAGAAPSHQALLDYLASEFVAPTSDQLQPWSVKSMIRLLVTSDAFKRSSQPQQSALAIDGSSRMLWRFPPRRVEAEVVRDSILLASGVLNPEKGGRSYRIHNIKKTYAQWEVVDNHGADTFRRMIYQERMRRVDDQMFTAFDFPDCGQVRAKRPVSTTPLQALNLMNSQFVQHQADLLAKRAIEFAAGDTRAAIKRCFELLLGRQPDKQEVDDCLQVAQQHGLPMVCRALINSNEFIFLP